MNRVVLKGGFVVSADVEVGNVPECDVLIDGSRIAAISPDLQVSDARTIDARGMIVMPGFIDTHRHLWQGPMRGVSADWSLLNYLGGIRLSAAACYDADDMYAAQFQGALEAINAGVTTVADYCHNVLSMDHAEQAIAGLSASGLRCVWAYGFNQPPSTTLSSQTERLGLARQLAKHHFTSRDSLLTLGVAPEEMPLWRSHEDATRQFQFARETGARIFWHCNCVNGADGGRPREISRLQQLGLLGSDIVFVHMNLTTEEEWRLVAASGAGVACTPDTELQMGMGAPVIVPARRHGIVPGCGTDIVSNNGADMFAALRLALQVGREQLNRSHDGNFYDGVPIRCEEALTWGTLGGARALGLESSIGSITPGKQADIALIDVNGINLIGWDRSNPAATIIQQAHAGNVDTVLIAGRLLKYRGKLVEGEQRACELLAASAERIAARVQTRGGFYVSAERTLELLRGGC